MRISSSVRAIIASLCAGAVMLMLTVLMAAMRKVVTFRVSVHLFVSICLSEILLGDSHGA